MLLKIIMNTKFIVKSVSYTSSSNVSTKNPQENQNFLKSIRIIRNSNMKSARKSKIHEVRKLVKNP